MTESIKLGAFLEKGKERAKNGWNNLKETMGRVRDRFGMFSEETKAELVVISRPVINGVKEVATGIKNSYNEVEGNVFQRVGNVFKEGYEEMKEKFLNLRGNVKNKIEELKERTASEGVMSFVHEALNKVEELPVYIQTEMAIFQEKKQEVIIDKAGKITDGKSEEKLNLLSETYDHINNRREYFESKRLEMTEKLVKMRAGRQAFATARMAV